VASGDQVGLEGNDDQWGTGENLRERKGTGLKGTQHWPLAHQGEELTRTSFERQSLKRSKRGLF